MIGGERLGDVLQDDGFAGSGLRRYERALPLPQRRDDVDDAAGLVLDRGVIQFKNEASRWIERRQIVEMHLVLAGFGVLEIDRRDLQQGEVALPVFRAADWPLDRVAGAQAKAADLRGGNVDIVGTGQ